MLLVVAAEQDKYTLGYLTYLAMIVVSPLLWIIVPRTFNLLERRQANAVSRTSPRLSRLQALEFVAQHEELKQLGDNDALTVARVLSQTLEVHGRRQRRFDIFLAAASMLVGAVVGRLLS